MKIVNIEVAREEWRLIQATVRQEIAAGKKPPFMVHQRNNIA